MQTVACGFCGGALDLTPESLRRHILVCIYCDAVQRLTDEGAVKAGAIPEARPPPVDVMLKDSPEAVQIVLPRSRTNLSLTKQDLVRGAIYTAPLGVFFVLSFDLLFGLAGWAGVGGVAAFLRAKTRRHLPPVTVRAGQITSSGGFERPFPAAAVRQIYASRTSVTVPGQPAPAMELFNVWALLHDEQRVHVAGPLDEAETALWVEEYLENRMGIAQLPVAGESAEPAAAVGPAARVSGLAAGGGARESPARAPPEDLPRHAAPPTAPAHEAPPRDPAHEAPPRNPAHEAPPKDPARADAAAPGDLAAPSRGLPARKSSCDACGAPLAVGPEAERSGWIRCGFCEGLTLLYPPGADHPVLGLGQPTAPRRFEVKTRFDERVVQQVGFPEGFLPRVVAATMVAPTAGGIVLFGGMFLLATQWERLPGWAIAAIIGGALLFVALGAWYVLAAVLRKPAVRLGPDGIAEIIRPLPVPFWPGRRTLDADEIDQIRVRSYAGASKKGFYRKVSEQMSRSGEIAVEEIAGSLGSAGAIVELTRVEAVPFRGIALTLAEGIEHPTEAFEIADLARATLPQP